MSDPMNWFPTSRRNVIKLLAAGAASWPLVGRAQGAAPTEWFGLNHVSVAEGPFLHAQDVNLHYMMEHDVDRFLVPYRQAAGIKTTAQIYPNWEAEGLGGHVGGHYLTALSQMAAAGDVESRRRLERMVAALAECQRASGGGYVGPYPVNDPFWQQLKAGKIEVSDFGLNGKWVPFYNLHKMFAGLRDAWLIAGNVEARDVLIRMSDWTEQQLSGLSDDQMQQMLQCEHGGMNEVFADVYAITGEPRYLRLARRFSHRLILDPLLRGEDQLDGLHANTQIPKVIGFARIAELSNDGDWFAASRFFWETVVQRRSVAIGGHGVREHFNPVGDFSSMVQSPQGPESCNSYNMLKLSAILYRTEPLARYADFSERVLFNHILSSQHPQHGGLVYFTPMRPRHYRVYSQANECFWCCVGTGMENHGKYAGFVYARGDASLTVNQFIASTLNWPEQGLRLTQATRFPEEARTELRFALDAPRHFSLRLRHPQWVAQDAFEIRINGQPEPGVSASGNYRIIERQWRDGDVVEIALPMQTTIERLPDGSEYVAVLHGPIVLAARTGTEHLDGLIADDARMAHVANGPLQPLDKAPMLVADPDDLASGIKVVAGQPLRFSAVALIRPADDARRLTLEPFHGVHDARYMVYWRTTTAADYPRLVRQLHASEAARLALEARTLDLVEPGEQQPEVEHHYSGEGSETGTFLGRHWRSAKQWFGYDLVAVRKPTALMLTYDGGQRDVHFHIELNGERLAEVTLQGGKPDSFVAVDYPIPAPLLAADGHYRLRFVAAQGSATAAIYEVRLIGDMAGEGGSAPRGQA